MIVARGFSVPVVTSGYTPTTASFAATCSYDISIAPLRRSTAWKRLTVGTHVKSWMLPAGSLNDHVTTTRSSISFT